MQRYFGIKKEGDYLFLNKDDLYHIKTVMRMNSKDLVEIVYDNKVNISQIEENNNDIKFKIIKIVENISLNKPYIALIIPILKETKMDLILQKGTEMGVDEFIICPMERCVVKLESKKIESKLSRWTRICKEASEQSKRTNIPNMKIINNLKDLEHIQGVSFTCSTQEKEKTLKKALKSHRNCDRMNLVIGPEGGLSTKEEEVLNSINFERITLGNLIMRVETVPLYLTSAINYEYME